MSIMNILSVTLIILIVASGLALFFGMRAAQANEIVVPIFDVPPQQAIAMSEDAMNDVAAQDAE